MKKIVFKMVIFSFILAGSTLAQQQDLWTTITTADGLANNNVTAILESTDGTIWFGTFDEGISRYHLENLYNK